MSNATARLLSAFNRNGWLTKVTGCWGDFCHGGKEYDAHQWLRDSASMAAWPPRVENDCGTYCAAFSWLHPKLPFSPFSWWGYKSGIMLAFDATAAVWDEVQCMSVTDAFTSTRACCSCDDDWNCPWSGLQSKGMDPGGYCSFKADGSCADDTCRALAAGCGVSLYDLAGEANCADGSQWCGRPGVTQWGENACGETSVLTGQCDACKTPFWCDDNETSFGSWGSIRTPNAWVDEFFDRDGGTHYGVRQCRFKPSQRDFFLRTMQQRFVLRQGLDLDWRGWHHDHANVWNEVNMYVEPNANPRDDRLAETLYRSLLGIIYVRTAGTAEQLASIRELTEHWRGLGVDVPVFAVSAEEIERVQIWTPDVLINLLEPAYNLEAI